MMAVRGVAHSFDAMPLAADATNATPTAATPVGHHRHTKQGSVLGYGLACSEPVKRLSPAHLTKVLSMLRLVAAIAGKQTTGQSMLPCCVAWGGIRMQAAYHTQPAAHPAWLATQAILSPPLLKQYYAGFCSA